MKYANVWETLCRITTDVFKCLCRYPGGLEVCDGGRVAGVVGRLLSREDVVELEVAGAGSQHQETLAG